jgi:hypothetical protein
MDVPPLKRLYVRAVQIQPGDHGMDVEALVFCGTIAGLPLGSLRGKPITMENGLEEFHA